MKEEEEDKKEKKEGVYIPFFEGLGHGTTVLGTGDG